MNDNTNGHGILPAPNSIGDLSNKIALVTGGSSGLGRAIAEAYVAAGAFVVSADLSPNPPKAPILASTLSRTDLSTPTVELLNKRYPPSSDGRTRAVFIHCDVTSALSVEAAVAFTVQHYGRLDIMVNNAGISGESKATDFAKNGNTRIHETDPSILDISWAVNGRGVWLGCKYAAAQMLKQEAHVSGDRGWIINMCSICGFVALPGMSSYAATKGAVLNMTKAIALEYALDRIHVNCINPGFTETNILEAAKARGDAKEFDAGIKALHPWGRMGVPEEIAKVAVFLAGDGASFITGAPFLVDGGYCAR